jgi:hypothetical protein
MNPRRERKLMGPLLEKVRRKPVRRKPVKP